MATSTPMTLKEVLLRRIVSAYRDQIVNERFNGIKLGEVAQDTPDEKLKIAIISLVEDRTIDVLSSGTQLNPHIKRHPVPDHRIQIEKLDVTEKYHTCLYPTKLTIEREYDLRFLDTKPFTKRIACGDPQLAPIFFEIGALDRYRLDPRYDYHFSEYDGRFSISEPNDKTGPIPERDQTWIQTFGLGMDDENNAVVCVFLRYLDQLSAEHQQHWQTFTIHRPALIHENYYKPSYLGEFYENNSGISALRVAIDSINSICVQIWSTPLFRSVVPDELHYNLSPFMRSSKVDYFSFVHELDKLISENINETFFEGKVASYSVNRHPDGTMERKRKGSLSLLEEWLFSGEINWRGHKDEARKEIIQPLRRIRRARQAPAHSSIKNDYDRRYTTLRRTMLADAAFALGKILQVLLTHPKAPKIELPRWFEEGRIEVI